MSKEEETFYDKCLKSLKNSKPAVYLFQTVTLISMFALLLVNIGTIYSFFFPSPKSTDSVQVTENSPKSELSKPAPKKLEKKENALISKTYNSKIVDKNGNGIAGVELFCSNCKPQLVHTRANGTFTLNAKFSDQNYFWNSTLTLTKDGYSTSQIINWREESPQPITF